MIKEHDGIKYLINELKKTASIINGGHDKFNITIPRSIEIDSIEYFITSISENAFNHCDIRSVQFSANSKLQIIEKKAFFRSSIEKIFLPSSLTKICENAFGQCRYLRTVEIPENSELQTIEKDAFSSTLIERFTIPSKLKFEDGWPFQASNLVKIDVNPKNSLYKVYEDKFIIGKTSEEEENYDILVFCVRDIKKVTIPNFIRIIGSFSFYECKYLQEVEFESNSKLEIIEKFSFCFSEIRKFSVPSSVTQICEGAFGSCYQLQSIEFPNDSQLKEIGYKAFSLIKIDKITIPIHVTKICKLAFYYTLEMQTIEIPENSELQTIDEKAFVHSSIESLSIPSKLIELKDGWCSATARLNKIFISENNPRYRMYENEFIIGKKSLNNECFDDLVFCIRSIKEVIIPSFIKEIKAYSFNGCRLLKKIEFHKDSELEIIGENAFSFTSIKCFSMPSHLTKIGVNAFSYCDDLQVVEYNEKCDIIDKKLFDHNEQDLRLMIPFKNIKILNQ